MGLHIVSMKRFCMWTVTFWHSLKPYTREHIASQKVMLEQHMNSNEVHVHLAG